LPEAPGGRSLALPDHRLAGSRSTDPWDRPRSDTIRSCSTAPRPISMPHRMRAGHAGSLRREGEREREVRERGRQAGAQSIRRRGADAPRDDV